MHRQKTSLIAAAALVALAACNPSPLISETAEPTLPASGAAACEVVVDTLWSEQGYGQMRVEGATRGPNCSQAVVLLTVRQESGAPLLAWAGRTQDLFGLKDATTPDAMKPALQAWLRQDQASLARTGVLPDWPADADAPSAGEFPFYPEDWIDRATWAELKAADAPLFAFAQGMESQAVYMLRDGALERIGVQTFPG